MALQPGDHISTQRRLLHPSAAAHTLAEDARDIVNDLVFVGHGRRSVRGVEKDVFLLSHPLCAAMLYCVSRPKREIEPASAAATASAQAWLAAAAGEAAAGGAAPAPELREEEEDGDMDFDDDTVIVPDEAPIDPLVVQYTEFGDFPVDLVVGRVPLRARVECSGLNAGFLSPAAMFTTFLPASVVARIVRATNAADTSLALTADELLCWVGVLMVASRFAGSRLALWSTPETKYDPRPPVGDAMSRRRFDSIAAALRLTDKPRPPYVDKFHAVRELIDDFNAHLRTIFRPSDLVCLDESMVTFNNARSPGNMFVPRKPNPVGNEYHTICDVETGILFRMELVEGKDRPPEMGAPKYEAEHKSKTTGLILRMTETIRGQGRRVIMDSAFCVMSAVVALFKTGIYCSTVAKKRAHWPRHVRGDEVLQHMAGKPVGQLHCRRGTLDGIVFNLFAVNHQRYTFMLISTYGSTLLDPEERRVYDREGNYFSFRRNEPITDYYRARHAVDDHNHLRQGQRVSLERAWGSKFWENRQLAFVISATLTNAQLAYNHFVAAKHGKPQLNADDFKLKVATELIRAWEEREKDETLAAKRAKRRSGHALVNIPKHQGATTKTTRTPYQQVRCKGAGCNNRVRTHCSCDRSLALCCSCFSLHVTDAAAMC